MQISMTDRAAQYIREQMDKDGKPDAAIRFGVVGGGCTGFSYLFDFTEADPNDADQVFNFSFGVRVYVDPKSASYLDGTRIDFETGIRDHGFRIHNPNVTGHCGCGESVSF
jgi:iron-sulfur cluster assembly protein